MALETRQLHAIIARFRRQYALEIGARALFWGLLAAAAVILVDKIQPFPLTWEPGFLALGIGLGIGVIAGIIASFRRFRLDEAARAVDAHYALQEQLGSAHDLAQTEPAEFEAALAAQANRLARSENFTRDFRLRPPAYTRQASLAAVCAGLLLFAPPFATLFPEKRAEMQELRERETQLLELAKELKEIRKDDKELDDLSEQVKDLAARAQKNRLSKEDFLRELDEIQKELESQAGKLNKEGTAEALKNFEESLLKLDVPEIEQQKNLADRMEALKKALGEKSLKFDQLDQLERELSDQQRKLEAHPELNNLKKEAGKLREEALKQQQEKLEGEVSRLLDAMQKETREGSQKTPSDLKQQMQQQTDQLSQKNQQGGLKSKDLEGIQKSVQQQKQPDPAAASRMESLLNKLDKALDKDASLNEAERQQQEANAKEDSQANKEGDSSPSDRTQQEQGPQGESQGQNTNGSQPGEKQDGDGQQGAQGQQGSPNQGTPTQGGQGQQSVDEYIKQQGGAQGGEGGQPMDGAPEMSDSQGEGGGSSGKGSSGSFQGMSKQELADWAELLENYKDMDSAADKAGACRGGGKPGQGAGGGSSSSWGLGHDPIGRPSYEGGGQAPDKNGADTQQSSMSLEQLLDFQAIYDPHLIDAKTREDVKLTGQMGEGESGGFTMIKAPNTEEGDAVTPYFSVNPETADSEVQALEDQDIPANLKQLVREYFESLEQ